jgi:hypothetical protein
MLGDAGVTPKGRTWAGGAVPADAGFLTGRRRTRREERERPWAARGPAEGPGTAMLGGSRRVRGRRAQAIITILRPNTG